MDYLEVAQILENFIEGRGGEWDWDDYISGMKFNDPYLRSIQERMALLTNEFPPTSKGQYCGPAGTEVMRRYIDDLRAKAVTNG
jgi:hypothetical protein